MYVVLRGAVQSEMPQNLPEPVSFFPCPDCVSCASSVVARGCGWYIDIVERCKYADVSE